MNSFIEQIEHIETQQIKMGAERIHSYIQLIKKQSIEINEIDLSSTYAADSDWINLFRTLMMYNEIEILRLNDCQLSDDAIKVLSTFLYVSPSLMQLELRENDLQARHMSELANALEYNATLTHLDLGMNNIRSYGAHIVADAVKSNQQLVTLLVNDNHIGDAGIKELTDALLSNTGRLAYLDVTNNFIGERSVDYVAQMLQCNEYLAKQREVSPQSASHQNVRILVAAIEDNVTMPRRKRRSAIPVLPK